MNESTLAGIPREGQTIEEVFASVDKELEVETPAESPAEKKEEVKLPDEAHFLKQNARWEEMRVAKAEAEAKTLDLEARLAALEKPNTVEQSDFVTSLVGENEEVEQKWINEKKHLKEEVKRELIQDTLNAEKKAKEQEEYWVKWTNDKLEAVEKEFKVDFKTDESLKNELSKIMVDFSPTDGQGNLDYSKGMKILTEFNKAKALEETQKTKVKKNIADATVSKETSEQQNKGFVTSNDLRGKSWRSLIN